MLDLLVNGMDHVHTLFSIPDTYNHWQMEKEAPCFPNKCTLLGEFHIYLVDP